MVLNHRKDIKNSSIKLKKPDWIKVKLPSGHLFADLKNQVKTHSLSTVCEEAKCPNIAECWATGTATFMLLGDTCTRGCRFCSVKTGNPAGYVDLEEPLKVAESIARYRLSYVVITSVDRDDLEDFGAEHFAKTITKIKEINPGILVEVLIPDFQNNLSSLNKIIQAAPEVIAHNVETTRELTPFVRDKRATYKQSLQVLKTIKQVSPATYTKSSIMVGLGERYEDVLGTLQDLRDMHVDIVTLGQYLQPTGKNLAVKEYVTPQMFEQYKKDAYDLGFMYVASGPLVRSSYRAAEAFIMNTVEQQDEKNQRSR